MFIQANIYQYKSLLATFPAAAGELEYFSEELVAILMCEVELGCLSFFASFLSLIPGGEVRKYILRAN